MRKKLYVIFVFAFFYTACQAQNLKFAVKIAPDLTFTDSKNEKFEKGQSAFGASGILSIQYFFSKKICVGIDPAYIYDQRKFRTHWGCFSIPEVICYKEHFVNSHGIQIPLSIRYGNNKFYLLGQYGISFFPFTNYKIVEVSYNMNTPDEKNKNTVLQDNLKLYTENGNVGQYASIGVGRMFGLFNQIFTVELKYSFDLVKWVYKPEDSDLDNLKFKTQSISLSVGVILENEKRRNKCAEFL